MCIRKNVGVGIALLVLSACGGGGGGSNTVIAAGSDALQWQEGVFLPSSDFEAQCQAPRDDSDFRDLPGSAQHERMWLRSWSDETYLWFEDIPDQDPANFSVRDYFDELVTPELSPSGRPLDNFHFTFDTEEWLRLSQSGVSSGYGVQFAVDNAESRRVSVAFVEPNASAAPAPASIARGARVVSVDGVDITATDANEVAVLNAGLFPSEVGETHVFGIQDLGATEVREVILTSEDVVTAPVPTVSVIDAAQRRVGYILFNDHIAPAEGALVDAVNTLSAQAIDELVLDLRYNGGGFLTIASQLGFMIAGEQQSAGRTFELLQFNSKHPEINPITGARITPVLFNDETQGFSLTRGQALPSLNLSRVYVLTGPGTCSASESIINSLVGIDIEVIQIGTTTCGKPFGFFPTDNCGTTYFTIQFRGVNDQNFGDFSDGFSPTQATPISPAELPGCVVNDDLQHTLGDPAEAKLAAALHHIETGLCPDTVSASSATDSEDPVLLGVPPWRTNRMMMKRLPQ